MSKYPGFGNLYQAKEDAKSMFLNKGTDTMPEYWQMFAQQLVADIFAMEMKMIEAGIKVPKPMKLAFKHEACDD